MAEYIERNAAVQAMKELLEGPGISEGVSLGVQLRILAIPAEEVAPVRHGRWIWADDGYCRCSECGQKAPVVCQYQDEPETVATDYCPNCGAKMDGEEGENGRM